MLLNNLDLLTDLKNRFKQLSQICQDKKVWNALTKTKQLEIEKTKFTIMQIIQDNIEHHYGKLPTPEIKAKPVERKNTILEKLLFGFLMITDIALASVGGYLGSIGLLKLLFPGISTAVTILTAMVTLSIEGVMRYSIFKSWLKQSLGITEDYSSESLVINYKNRLNLMNKLNSTMVNNIKYICKKDIDSYQQYAGILKCFNQDMKRTQLDEFNEPISKKVGRYFLSTINIGFSIAATYFTSIALLGAIAAALLGTPVGWGIIAGMIITKLITQFLIRQSSIYTLLNPSANEYNHMKDELNQFKDKTQEINTNIHIIHKLDKLKQINTIQKKNHHAHKKLCPQTNHSLFFTPSKPLHNGISDRINQNSLSYTMR